MQANTLEQMPIKAIQYDGQVHYAIGTSRTTLIWKNKPDTWSGLLEKFSKVTRTPETFAQYQSMTKDEQGRYKDQGGFVGGYLKEGRRKPQNVQNRTLITLDADFADESLWQKINFYFPFAMCLYSTHSHSSANYRVRLVAPLSRPVFPDEYKAISRFIAAELGINAFDDTTYQPERLMYWPSVASDGEFIFKYQDQPWIDPDKLLEKYPYWQDATTWPESDRARKVHQKHADKQGNPKEKPGIIGAFNRSYTIHEAIEKFIPEAYMATEDPNRYTYAEGSAAAGAIVYDDEFIFSHHGTDPISGLTCNAFDMVRLHMFSVRDEDEPDDTAVNKLPSYHAMSDLALGDSDVRIELSKVYAQPDIGAAFGQPILPEGQEEQEDNSWRASLRYNQKGQIETSLNNVLLILRHDSGLKGIVAYNEFSRRIVLKKSSPWRQIGRPDAWADSDDAFLAHYIEVFYKYSHHGNVDKAILMIAKENLYHPVREYLDSLSWDGVERLETMLTEFLGVEDSAYTRAISRKWMIAGAGRIRKPGIKFDHMLILVGSQGLGKSQFFSRIAKRLEWFSDSKSKFDNSKESMEELSGKWIIELSELSAMRGYEAEHTKTFLTKQEDTYRPAYGKRTESYMRQCVFGGTTNRDDFLKDSTGARRFWPIKVGDTTKLWSHMTQEVVDQLWAEADLRFRLNLEKLYLDGDAQKEAKEKQEQYTDVSGKVGKAAEFLDSGIPHNWLNMDLSQRKTWLSGFRDGQSQADEKLYLRTHICAAELYVECFEGFLTNMGLKESREMRDILRTLGWEDAGGKKKSIEGYGRQRYFVRPREIPKPNQ